MTTGADRTWNLASPDGTPSDWTDGTPALLVSHCEACGRKWYLRRPACPSCGGARITRIPAAGRGHVAAVTVAHRRVRGGDPIGIALVDLEEGVRVMTRCRRGTTVGQAVSIAIVSLNEPGETSSLVPMVL